MEKRTLQATEGRCDIVCARVLMLLAGLGTGSAAAAWGRVLAPRLRDTIDRSRTSCAFYCIRYLFHATYWKGTSMPSDSQ